MTTANGGAPKNQWQLPGWAISSLRQPLPRTVRPVCDETLQSYLWRLARANSLNPHYFTEYVRGSMRHSVPISPDAVITLSGQPNNSMRYAILELCTPQQLTAMNVAGRPRPGSSNTGEKCHRCTHARGIYDPVRCWRRTEDVICLPHRRWTMGSPQLDLTAHDHIIQANKHHRQLIRQYGRDAARHAFNQASSIVSEWTERGTYRGRIDEQLHRFHGSEWSVSGHDSTLLASQYLPAVALTRLLVSPEWKSLAIHPEDNATFVAEVRRTVDPRYIWDPTSRYRYFEPLARALLRERESRDSEAAMLEPRRKYSTPEQPRRPGETIEADELRQDN